MDDKEILEAINEEAKSADSMWKSAYSAINRVRFTSMGAKFYILNGKANYTFEGKEYTESEMERIYKLRAFL